MKVVAISGTIGIADDFARLSESMGRHGRLVIVDQSDGGLSRPRVPTNAVYIRDGRRGLSRARNLGLKQVPDAEILAFPDDNAYYQPESLEKVVDFFISHPEYSFVSGRQVTPVGSDSMLSWPRTEYDVTLKNVPRVINSSTLFLRREGLSTVGGFNESLGVGAGTRWGAGEENDLVYRLLRTGLKGRYLPTVIIVQEDWSAEAVPDLKKIRTYNRGLIHAMAINELPFPIRLYWVARALGQIMRGVLHLSLREISMGGSALLGRLEGAVRF